MSPARQEETQARRKPLDSIRLRYAAGGGVRRASERAGETISAGGGGGFSALLVVVVVARARRFWSGRLPLTRPRRDRCAAALALLCVGRTRRSRRSATPARARPTLRPPLPHCRGARRGMTITRRPASKGTTLTSAPLRALRSAHRDRRLADSGACHRLALCSDAKARRCFSPVRADEICSDVGTTLYDERRQKKEPRSRSFNPGTRVCIPLS